MTRRNLNIIGEKPSYQVKDMNDWNQVPRHAQRLMNMHVHLGNWRMVINIALREESEVERYRIIELLSRTAPKTTR